MWGRFCWLKRDGGGRRPDGIAVLFAWLFCQENHLRPFVDLYWSLGWDCLVCHVDFLTQFFPEKATELAFGIAGELIKDDFLLLRECVSGQIYDSSPVDFTNDLDLQYTLKTPYPPRVVSWIVKAFASGLDGLFFSNIEAQRAEYWRTLYSSVSIGTFTILCSEDDKLVPFQMLETFAQRLQELGADVSLIRWSSSPHVDHYSQHEGEYRAAVREALGKASAKFASRRLKRSAEGGIPESVWRLHKAALSSNESLRRVAIRPSDHFYLPSSIEFDEDRAADSTLFRLPSIQPHGVLGQVLFDVCVPKNIEGWDIKLPPSTRSSRHFNPIKCIRRSRL